ncbi:hypothetical protein BB559_004073 [Furculomyces boomerangus]|uniref:Xaa-Pro aminopeptidase P n=2 Tax=Harpellales TaxID=61421 RepID=A0A2T9YGU9_9FUNG|nr:hypothetical protein BB559_004073 [Furculomyces boomerangus]PWA00263.1 hypothetical protein BB558_003680 [Smittium angustum]
MTTATGVIVPTDTTEKLKSLRTLMADPSYNIDAYIIPSEDAHQSEYIGKCDKRRTFISGFTGSFGSAVVTQDTAIMFTDGRYVLQARAQMDTNWELLRIGVGSTITMADHLSTLKPGSRIGVDPSLISYAEAKNIQNKIKKNNCELVPISTNLVDIMWADKPELPKDEIFFLKLEFSGISLQEKLIKVREMIKKHGATGLVVAGLDQIAWLFNLRGSDIDNNPLFYSYAIVTDDKVSLFVEKEKLAEEAVHNLKGVEIFPYTDIFDHLKLLSKSSEDIKIITDSVCSWAIVEAIGTENIVEEYSPITVLKLTKNSTELDGMRNSHIRDGVASVKFYSWLERELVENNMSLKISESEAADKLLEFVMEQKNAVGKSFATISSVGPNAAVIHYSPTKGSDSLIDLNKIYLVDAGFQYLDGTTDMTRTWHFGTPTAWEKECYTRVLKGFIKIDDLVFPSGTTGYVLDPIARMSLWEAGIDFRHNTGHGVGSFLNVHEGPIGIGVKPYFNDFGLEAGMVVTNEPGYYEDGNFGARIENVCIIVDKETPHNYGGTKYLTLESVSLCPIQTKLIMPSLMEPREMEWLNNYHKLVWEKLSPHLEKGSYEYEWLSRNTASI